MLSKQLVLVTTCLPSFTRISDGYPRLRFLMGWKTNSIVLLRIQPDLRPSSGHIEAH